MSCLARADAGVAKAFCEKPESTFLADRFKRNTGFEVRGLVLSFLPFGSSLSSGDPPFIKATLETIVAGHPQNRIDDLLPWNFKLSS